MPGFVVAVDGITYLPGSLEGHAIPCSPFGPRGSPARRRVVVTCRTLPTPVVCGFLLLGSLSGLACDDDPAGPDSIKPVLTVSPTEQWAGGEVRISIVGMPFEDGDVVVAGSDTLEIFDRQYFLLGVRLPTDGNGLTALTVLRDGESLGSVETEVYGFEEFRNYPDRLAHYITEFPVEWGVAVVGPAYWEEVNISEGITWIHLSSGMHRRFAGTPDPSLTRMYRTGVDPVSGELYFELRGSDGSDRPNLHRARIVGGQLVDLGWVSRTCNRWGCEPLAGDIWIAHEYLFTCRLAAGPEPKSCEFIEHLRGDDPQWIRRLWSADIGLVQTHAFRMSTGEFVYSLRHGHPTTLHPLSKFTTDEGRGLFYASNGGTTPDSVSGFRIHALQGHDGTRVRSSPVVEADRYFPQLGYDPDRDVILIVRHDTWTVEIRDPILFQLQGEIQLPDLLDDWLDSIVLVDRDTDRAFIVYSAGWVDGGPTPGTPVFSIRLPPF